MNKDNKILVITIFIVLILFIFSFPFGITGAATANIAKTTIQISPKAVTPGEIIYVTINPGPEGVNEKINFYQAEDNLRKISINKLCNDYKCFESSTVSFTIPTNWEYGIYNIKIYDYGINNFVQEEFTIKSS